MTEQIEQDSEPEPTMQGELVALRKLNEGLHRRLCYMQRDYNALRVHFGICPRCDRAGFRGHLTTEHPICVNCECELEAKGCPSEQFKNWEEWDD